MGRPIRPRSARCCSREPRARRSRAIWTGGQVLKTGRPARFDDYNELPGTIAAAVRKTGFRAVAGAPIIVDGGARPRRAGDGRAATARPRHLPAALTAGGLRAGVDALASRMPVPIEIDVTANRLPAAVEATAYFVVAEALTNVAKHAHAARASVAARVEDGTFRVQVRDDGVGGARPDESGLLGLADRLAALDGQLRVESPFDRGTLVAADFPIPN